MAKKKNRSSEGKQNKKTGANKKYSKAREVSYKRTVELTKDQKRALGVLESGYNVFLSGEAGTGKSFVLNEYIYRNKHKNIIVCAPTGIAAIHVGGATLHRVFKVPISVTRPGEYNAKPEDSVVKADVIVVDEISMCRCDIFEYVIRTIQWAEQIRQDKENVAAMNAGDMPKVIMPKQIIVVGDFFQLAPVVTPNDRDILKNYWDMHQFGEGFAFASPLWKELDFKNVVLKEIVRQKGSAEYIANLNKIRKGDAQGIPWFNANTGRIPLPNSIYLCGTNRAADYINEKESQALKGTPTIYKASTKGQVQASDKMTGDSLSLKVGMQVMTLVNNLEEGYQNGSLGKIVSLGKDSVEVKLNSGKYVTVKPYDWEILGYEMQEDKLERIVLGNFKQLPLKIAYAITIHKSQGQTYSSANVSPDCFAAGQLYVALSRVQNMEGMTLEHDIRYSALKTSLAVKTFYENLVEIEEEYEAEDVPDVIEPEILRLDGDACFYGLAESEEMLWDDLPEEGTAGVPNELSKAEVILENMSEAEAGNDFREYEEVYFVTPQKASAFDKVQSMTEEELTDACYMYQVIKEKPNAYAPWTEEEEALMLTELDNGMTVGEIAEKHCRTSGAIRSRLKKMRER